MTFINISAKLRETFRVHLIGWSVASTVSVISLLFAWGFPDAWQKLATLVLYTATPQSLLAALCITVLIILVLISFLIPLLLEEKLIAKFGVYWDRKGNSYCPNCKSLTSQIKWATYNGAQWHGLYCSCSSHSVVLMDIGEPIHAQDAMRRMQKL